MTHKKRRKKKNLILKQTKDKIHERTTGKNNRQYLKNYCNRCVAEHRTGHHNMNVSPEERNARSVAKSAISLNVEVQIEM